MQDMLPSSTIAKQQLVKKYHKSKAEHSQIEPTVSGWRITIYQSVVFPERIYIPLLNCLVGWYYVMSLQITQTRMYFFKTLVIPQ